MTSPEAEGSAVERRGWRRPLRALLRVPLLYKILIANALIVALAAAAGAALGAALVRTDPGRSTVALLGLLGLLGAAVSVVVNALILKVALAPLREIERTARRVESGEFDARAPLSAVADRDLARLSRVMNGMLERLDTYRTRLQRLAAAALRAGEEERKRIAWELHDDAAQRLAALLLRLQALVRATDDPAVGERLEGFRDELAETLESIRRYARGLRPPALDDVGLGPAVESLARQISEQGVRVRVDAGELPPALGEEVELALYRMIQEALSNVARHSGATEATVRLGGDGGVVRAVVSDRGRGFDVRRQRERGTGLGLFGLGERAEYIGGTVSIQSAPGEGTTVHIEVPIGRPAPTTARP